LVVLDRRELDGANLCYGAHGAENGAKRESRSPKPKGWCTHVCEVLVVLTVCGLVTSWRRMIDVSYVTRGVGAARTPARRRRETWMEETRRSCMATEDLIVQ
jgi:hypothetical protein